jgi:hypothetical protein
MLNASTGEIFGTPGAPTTLSATFRATNAYGTNDKALSIVVNAAGALAPAIVTTSLPNITAYSQTSLPLEASGLLPISWSILGGTAPNRAAGQTTWTGGGLPAGLTLDQFTGQIRGKAFAPATSASFTAVATNSAGTANRAFSITALDVSSGAPSFITSVLPRGLVYAAYGDPSYGEFYDQRFIYVEGATPITYSVVAGSLPPGVTLSSLGLFGGRATTPGTYSFTVRATNSISFADRAFSIEIVARSSTLPVITTSKIPDLAVNSAVFTLHSVMLVQAFSVSANSFATTNGSNVVVVTQPSHPYTTGNSVQISGVYDPSGIPFNGVSASNLNGNFTITYIDANSFSIVIAVNATATGSGGSDFKTKLTPTWSTVANANPLRAIPAGLSINPSTGVISGTTTAAPGNYKFLVQVSNSAGTDQAEISVTVAATPTAPSTNVFKPTISVWNELSS